MITLDLVKIPRVGFKFRITGVPHARLRDIYSYKSDSGYFNPDPLVVKQLHDQFGAENCSIHPQILDSYDNYTRLIHDLHNPDIEGDTYNWGGVQLTPVQVKGVWFMEQAGGACILADAPGVGKTLATLALTRGYKRVLVVSPKTAKDNWYEEAAKWGLNESLKVIEGSTRAIRQKRLDEALQADTQYIAIHYGMLDNEKFPKLFETMWDCVLFDEAHYLKNRKAAKFEMAKKLRAGKKTFMTGTPFTNDAGDAWTMLNMIDPKRFGSYWTFVDHFANVNENYLGHTTVSGVNHAEDLNWLLSRYMILREKDIESKKVFKYHKLVFDDTQKIAYERARKEYIYNDQMIESDVEKFIRLLQISTDPYILGIDAPSVANDKILELLQQHRDAKVIVGTVYLKHVEHLKKILSLSGRDIFVVTGEAKNKKAVVDAFKRAGKYSILIATITSITESLSIDECNTMILPDLTFSPTKNFQFFNRIHRLTSTMYKTYHVLVTEGVNEHKQDLLSIKQEMIDALTGGEAFTQELPKDLQKYLMEQMKRSS